MTTTRSPLQHRAFDWLFMIGLAGIGLALIDADETWGLGRVWKRQPFVRHYPALR